MYLFTVSGRLRGGLFACSILLLLGMTGCSSLSTSSQYREEMLDAYLAQSQHLILYYPYPLQLDDQLKVLGMRSVDEKLVRQFDPDSAAKGLISHFVSHSPQLAETPIRIIDPKQWSSLSVSRDTPVLFFLATWKMYYQRLPPQFRQQRLQLGVIAKIIPLGQVLSGKGGIALHTAAWESRCQFDAFGGSYFSIDEWEANNASKLQQGVAASNSLCGETLAQEF